jgi:hypothetical protein
MQELRERVEAACGRPDADDRHLGPRRRAPGSPCGRDGVPAGAPGQHSAASPPVEVARVRRDFGIALPCPPSRFAARPFRRAHPPERGRSGPRPHHLPVGSPARGQWPSDGESFDAQDAVFATLPVVVLGRRRSSVLPDARSPRHLGSHHYDGPRYESSLTRRDRAVSPRDAEARAGWQGRKMWSGTAGDAYPEEAASSLRHCVEGTSVMAFVSQAIATLASPARPATKSARRKGPAC